jgi:hypothetical protein
MHRMISKIFYHKKITYQNYVFLIYPKIRVPSIVYDNYLDSSTPTVNLRVHHRTVSNFLRVTRLSIRLES